MIMIMFDVVVLAEIWPFSSSLMLWWAAAAVVPLVMHLWNRQRYQSTDWAATRFLHAALTKQSHLDRLRRWLLLATRIFILVLFASALANPRFAPVSLSDPVSANLTNTHTVLVLDDSYSMATNVSQEPLFSRAKQAARDLVGAAMQGEAFTLIAMANNRGPVIRNPSFDTARITRELDRLSIAHGAATLMTVLDSVDEVISAARQRFPRLTSTRVCFYTDLGFNTWSVIARDNVRDRLQRIGQNAELFVIDVGSSAGGNLAVTGIQQRQRLVTTQTVVEFVAEVHNFSQQDQDERPLKIWIDGQVVANKKVRIAANETAMVKFQHRFRTAGEHQLRFELSPDRLLIDNECWRCVPVRDSIDVLCIGGKSGAAGSVALAIEPRSTDPVISVELAAEYDLLERTLDEFDVVFLCNVGRIGSDEAAVLGRFVEAGGGLAVFLGDQVQPDSYNAWAGTEDVGRCLPGELGEVVAPTDLSTGFLLDPMRYQHPIAETFRAVPGSGLFQIPTYRYVRLIIPKSNGTEVVFRFSDSGDPALIEQEFGQGRCLVFASAASMQSVDRNHPQRIPWTILPTAGDFVSLIQEMLMRLTGGRTVGRNLHVGALLVGEFEPTNHIPNCQLFRPDGLRQVVKGKWSTEHPERFRWNFSRTQQAGIYRVEPVAEPSKAQLFAVNLDVQTGESDLRRVERSLLPQFFRYGVHQPSVNSVGLTETPEREYGWHLLVAVLLALLFESWLAGRAGGSGLRFA